MIESNLDEMNFSSSWVIYDMKFTHWSYSPMIHPKSQKIDEHINKDYFYMLKTNRSDNVMLKKRTDNMNNKFLQDSKQQIFMNLAKGFRHNGDVYLFDSLVGCVYIIHNFTMKLSEEKRDTILLKRTNVPYERFFHCRGNLLAPLSKFNKTRCETSGKLFYTSPRKPSYGTSNIKYEESLFWLWLKLACGGIIILFAFTFLFCFVTKSQNWTIFGAKFNSPINYGHPPNLNKSPSMKAKTIFLNPNKKLSGKRSKKLSKSPQMAIDVNQQRILKGKSSKISEKDKNEKGRPSEKKKKDKDETNLETSSNIESTSSKSSTEVGNSSQINKSETPSIPEENKNGKTISSISNSEKSKQEDSTRLKQ